MTDHLQDDKLIINADDFGLCEGINAGISKTLQYGIVKSVSVMPDGCAFESAIQIIKQHPGIKVGVHLSIHEYLTANNGFITRYVFKRIKKRRIMKEFRGQIEKLRDAGIEIAHLDSHQHIHIFPGIFKIAVSLAREYNISSIRLPSVPIMSGYFFRGARLKRRLYQLALNFLCAIYKPIMKSNGIHHCDYSFGFIESGHLAYADLKNILSSLKTKKGPCELVCHPAEENPDLRRLIGHWGYHWQQESMLLTSSSLKDYFHRNAVELAGSHNG